MRKIILLTFILLHNFCFAQNNKTDSLLNLLKKDKRDTTFLIHLNKLSKLYLNDGNFDSALLQANVALETGNLLLKENTNQPVKKTIKKNIGAAYNNIGIAYTKLEHFSEGLKNQLLSLKIRQELGDKKDLAGTYGVLGNIYTQRGNYPEALKNYLASLKLYEELNLKEYVEISYNNIGNVYFAERNDEAALKNYFTSLRIAELIGDVYGVAAAYNNIGNVYEDQGNSEDALKNYAACLKINEKMGDQIGVANCYGNIGIVYLDQAILENNISIREGKLNLALKNMMASLKIQNETEDFQGMASSYCNIGEAYRYKKDYQQAEKHLILSKNLSIQIGYKENLKNTYAALTKLDSTTGNFKRAYTYFKIFILYRDSLNSEETKQKTLQSQLEYDFDKKEAIANTEHKKELETQHLLAAENSRKQNIIIVAVIVGLLLAILFAVFVLRSLSLTNKQKKIIEIQKHEVEVQQKEIVDSINYAQRIQHSLLANKQLLKNNLPEHFVLFKPKGIVSGDFYWATQHGNKFYFAACDSTGHGVPGAFMSLLNISFLNEAVNEKNILEPHEILNHVRKRLIENMEGGQDGMDGVLICIETSPPAPLHKRGENMLFTYAAANNAPSIIKNGKLISLPTDKMPVGKGEKTESFTLRNIDLQKGDSLYLYTDGYADQFGGPKGKKFKYKQLDELLISNSNLPLSEQSEILNQKFEGWKGSLEQVDDVLVVGIKI